MKLGKLYEKFYQIICGYHPTLYPWHFQWHFLKDTHKWQKSKMSQLHGDILDIGCGKKPYYSWLDLKKVNKYVGVDVVDTPYVDVVVQPDNPWPFADRSFDCVLMTQTLEHLENPTHTLAELERILKPGGLLLLTVPFIYPVHGSPYDFKRYTSYGLAQLFAKNFTLKELKSIGNIGSVLATLLLTNIENNFNLTFIGRLIKGITLPLWVLFSFLVNMIGLVLNCLDFSNSHFCNSCLIAVRNKSFR